MRRTLTLFFLALTALLSGCATSWVVDNKVTTYSRFDAAPTELRYRFERLPSQQVQGAAQDQVEAWAAAAMAQVGLQHDEQAPRFSAQVDARVAIEPGPWSDPWFYSAPWPAWGYGPGWYGPGWGWYGPAYPPASTPWYVREVSVILRELPSHRVVYETHAFNDGPYSDSDAVLPVMFQAAMRGFPNPPQGSRRIDIPLPVAND